MNEIINIGKVGMGVKVRRALWNVVCVLLFRPFGTRMLWPWRRMLLMLFGAKVHARANVYASVRIWAPWMLQMDEGACLGPHVNCYNQALVRLENNAIVSQGGTLCTAGHTTDVPNNAENGLIVASIIIRKNAWIGMQAYVNMGVDVGEGDVVGARAAVFKDVEAGTVVGGNPAKMIKRLTNREADE